MVMGGNDVSAVDRDEWRDNRKLVRADLDRLDQGIRRLETKFAELHADFLVWRTRTQILVTSVSAVLAAAVSLLVSFLT